MSNVTAGLWNRDRKAGYCRKDVAHQPGASDTELPDFLPDSSVANGDASFYGCRGSIRVRRLGTLLRVKVCGISFEHDGHTLATTRDRARSSKMLRIERNGLARSAD
jgi:hypothetical protein